VARECWNTDGPEDHHPESERSVSKKTTLSHGQINGADPITVELIQPDSMPAAVRIVWPTAPTITAPARYNEVASTAMRLLAEASTTLARSKQADDCDHPSDGARHPVCGTGRRN
jgi:hypothetical protein